MAFRMAIVGRPNVGKSTLFNRLVGKRKALVDDQPGVTRDSREGAAQLGDLMFTVVDTAGLEDASPRSLGARMREHTARALGNVDLIVFVIDARAGVTPHDKHFAAWLRRLSKPILLVANKSERGADMRGLAEAQRLGFGEALPISAEHGEGMADLHAVLLPRMPADAIIPAKGDAPVDAPEEDKPIRVAIVGRPNVGKSTLVNRLLGEERQLTGPEPGITRDAIEIPWTSGSKRFVLVDTAGLRKKARVEDTVERLSTGNTIQALRETQAVILVLDATVMLEKQDLAIARLAIEEGRAVVIAANKWDLIDDAKTASAKLRDRLEISLPQLRGIEIVMTSALHDRKLDKLMRAVLGSIEVWNKHLPTPPLNRWLNHATEAHPPPIVGGRRPRLRFMRQIASRPPTFAIFGNKLTTLPDDYLRYLTNGIRDNFDLPGAVIRIELRQTDNPYVDADGTPIAGKSKKR
jgi:GTP-binding protein